MSVSDFLGRFWQDITGWAVLFDVVLTVVTLLWVLHIKREPMSAIAWSLTVVLMPFVGPFLFFLFGYQTIHRPLRQRRKRRKAYRSITTEPSSAVPARSVSGMSENRLRSAPLSSKTSYAIIVAEAASSSPSLQSR